jgi:DNA-directed RNA polymerase subunit RPC12/RpoP
MNKLIQEYPIANNLIAINPKLARQWHPTKNGSLTPNDVMPYSNKKIWWICQKGHEWEAIISNRSKGNGCPYCSGKAVNNENCLNTVNPTLSREWHPTKNGSLTPNDVMPYSNKKVWWICQKGHEWEATIASRSSGIGCPYCSRRAVNDENCLNTINPALSREWHPTKNGGLLPRDVTQYSHRKVWWLCSRRHEWEATITNRSSGKGCPYCSGKAVNDQNCLNTINPVLSREWHPTKNGSLTPNDIMPYSNKKIWWICQKGHEWEATIAHRSSGRSCPYCHSSTSQLELLTYCELKYLFHDALLRKRVFGKECDIFIPTLKLGIEIDGEYWHKDKFQSDKSKYLYLMGRGINLINVRGRGLDRISDSDVYFSSKDKNPAIVHRIMRKIAQQVEMDNSRKSVVEQYLNGHSLQNESEYKELLYKLPSPLFENSLQNLQPSVAQEWHPTKNGSLTPSDVTSYSPKKVWWICKKGHEWEAHIYSRSSGTGCPYCSGKAANNENCLNTINPALSREWHPTKNGSLTPNDIMPYSNKKIWWICKKGHEWEAAIDSRSNGTGCPYCSGKAVNNENCLNTVNPALSREWHPTKNGSLTPNDVMPYSSKKVWWICQKGHEWEAAIDSRSNGTGCPYCSGKAVNNENCLNTINPALSREWHPTKNGSLTPNDVMPYSSKKVWWLCENGHSWEAIISNRSHSNGCPYCTGQALTDENSLNTTNPALAIEWHPTKNGSLTPNDVMPYSNKKVWWICQKGHEWEADIDSRSNGTGCPYCSGKAVNNENCLNTINPALAIEWHPTKNGSLLPRDVTPHSHRKVWWLCSRRHEWEATIASRSSGSGCPYCSGKAVNNENCLNATNPELAREWHPIKNGSLTPSDVTSHSGKRVWWLCSRRHEWEATIDHRSRGRGCPYCSGKKKDIKPL